MTVDHIHVGSGQSHGIHATRLQLRHDVLVDQTTIDHGHHFEHIGVGDAPPFHHLALYAQG